MARKKSSDVEHDLGNAYRNRGHDLLKMADCADYADRADLIRSATAYFHRGAMTADVANTFIMQFGSDLIRGYALIAAQRIGLSRGMKQSLDESILWAMQNYSANDAQKITNTRENSKDGR